LNVLEHIPDDGAALADLRERLLPDGRLLLLVPAHPLLFGATDRAIGHQRRYSVGALRSLLRRRRFHVDALRPVNPVGAFGWLVSSRLLGRERIPTAPLRLYDALVPVLRPLDALRLPFGLSLWAVARPGR
jgi:SAM-dependent methyltransferase